MINAVNHKKDNMFQHAHTNKCYLLHQDGKQLTKTETKNTAYCTLKNLIFIVIY